MQTKIVEANLGRRAVAAIFDLFFAFLLGIGIFSLSSVAFTSHPDGTAIKQEMIHHQLESHLYYQDSDGNIKYYDNLVSYDKYEERLVYYYTQYLATGTPEQYHEVHDIYWYNVFILGLDDELGEFTEAQLSARIEPALSGKSVWQYEEVAGVKQHDKVGVPDISLYIDGDVSKGLSEMGKKVLLAFYYDPNHQNSYYNAARDLYMRPYYLNLVESYEKRATVYPLLIALPIAAATFYVVLPLIFRDGQSLGKKIMKLAVIRGDDYASTKPQMLLRQIPSILAIIILFIFLPITIAAAIALGILILSYALTIFTKGHRAVHDFIAFTKVVDDKESIYFKKGSIEETPSVIEEQPPVETENESEND